jgi:hypothetical protein
MEYAYRSHKDVPFGWVLWLQEALRRRAAKRAQAPARDGAAAAPVATN